MRKTRTRTANQAEAVAGVHAKQYGEKAKTVYTNCLCLFCLKGCDETDCKCNFCIHQRCIPETRWEPAEYYCDEDSDNYGTDWGCWLFEDADDVADAAADY